MAGQNAEDGGDRPAQHPLRRGRPHPPPLHGEAGACGGDRQGSAAPQIALRRPPGALLPARPAAARRSRRAAHGDPGRHGRRLPAPACLWRRAHRRRPRLRCGPAPARLGRAQPARLQPALPLPLAARRPRGDPGPPRCSTALSFRLKLALAAGFSPELGSCARCGEAEHLVGFSGAAGGVVCAGCEAGSFPLSEDAHRFMVESIARPLAEAPDAGERELRQAERAIGETLEHHAHVQLRAAA